MASKYLPSKEILLKINTSKKLSILPEKVLEITNYAISKSSTPTKILELADNRITDLTVIGTILSHHTKEGQPHGFRILEIANSKGNLDAGFRIAQMLSVGFQGTPKNMKLASEILDRQADQHPQSAYALSLLMLKRDDYPNAHLMVGGGGGGGGDGGKKDSVMDKSDAAGDFDDGLKRTERGVQLLTFAADAKLYPASTQLGHMYSKGIIVKKDPKKAVEYLTISSELDDKSAIFLLATHHQFGNGTPKDVKLAFSLFKRAAELGLAIAQHNIASIYLNGDEEMEVKMDPRKAIHFFEMAAEQGLQVSLINLGKMKLEGYGITPKKGRNTMWIVERDLRGAEKLFERAKIVEGSLGDEARLFLDVIKLEIEKEEEKNKKKNKWWPF